MAFDPASAVPPPPTTCPCGAACSPRVDCVRCGLPVSSPEVLGALFMASAQELTARDAELARLRERLRVAGEEAAAWGLRVTRAVISLAGDKRDCKRYFEMACAQATQASVDRSFAQFEAVSGCVGRALAILAPSTEVKP